MNIKVAKSEICSEGVTPSQSYQKTGNLNEWAALFYLGLCMQRVFTSVQVHAHHSETSLKCQHCNFSSLNMVLILNEPNFSLIKQGTQD